MMSIAAPGTLISAWWMPGFSFWIATVFSVSLVITMPQRPSAYEASLPISGRDVVFARFVAALGFSLIPLLVCALIVLLHTPAAFAPVRFAQCGALLTLANLLPLLVRPREYSKAPGRDMVSLVALGLSAGLAIRVLPSWSSSMLLFTALILAAIVAWHSTPESYQAVDERLASPRQFSVPTGRRTQSDALRAWRMLAGTLFTKHRLFQYGFGLFLGATAQWPIYIFSLASLDDLKITTQWTHALPFSHRTRLWMLVGPGVVVPTLLVVMAMQIHIPGYDFANAMTHNSPTAYREGSDFWSSETHIGLAFWHMAPGTDAPVATSPWGETVRPFTARIFGRTFYNPYSTRSETSQRFADLQFERLTTAVYGRAIDVKTYRALRVYPRRTTACPRMMILGVSAAVCGVLLMLLLLGIFNLHVFSQSRKRRLISTYVMLLIPLGFMMYGIFAAGVPDLLPALVEMLLLALLPRMPSNPVVFTAIAFLPAIALYFLLEWQFAHSEYVPGMIVKR